MTKFNTKLAGLILVSGAVSGCGMTRGLLTTVGPDYQQATLPVAEQWQTPALVAHQGEPENLQQWWQRFNDPVLDTLLKAAEQQSSSVAKAKARISEARANVTSATAAALPNLDSTLGANRTAFSFGGPVFIRDQYQLNLQSSWEIDLFGGLARQQEMYESQLESRHAAWHDARVAVAAEVANAYLAYRYDEILIKLADKDAVSRRESARLIDMAGQYGLRAPADVALSQASAADGNNILLQRQLLRDRAVKGLVAMTGLAEAEVQGLLTASVEVQAKLPQPPPFIIDSIPARVLLQRPDVHSAERDMAEASAKIGVELAQRFPRLSLTGNIAESMQSLHPSPLMYAQTWSLGPSISLPLFDAGKRAANVETARAQYEAAAVNLRSVVRNAAKEVEEALLRLNSAAARLPEVQKAAQGYAQNLRASEELYRAGLGNLVDVELNRRTAITAETAVAELEQESVAAWIALYRAIGGGWENIPADIPDPALASADR
ncbi:efflux transporter outer membrane subunit [Methylomonas paludis]|uniref:Efflux transporter outer membrane subunit n=1 Tax=Methylomonas paludis TaxID=1173101 RepID=A0A975R878_9GAMM|nr:efflux transporter outer membrane subunit [Methylomonas paludis]QWF70085.1 efflux transporter outer membrane subunit [Methylomonas paludis]